MIALLLAAALQENVVLDSGDTLIHREAFVAREPDPRAPDGVSIRMIRSGRPAAGTVEWMLDDSVLRIGEPHTLWAVLRWSSTGVARLDAEIVTRYSEAPLRLSAEIPRGGGDWTVIRLGEFTLDRDTVVAVRPRGPRLQDLWLDRLYVTAAYPPVDRVARDRALAPPNGYVPRDHFTLGVVFRPKTPIDTDLSASLERQLFDIAASGAEVVFLAGVAADRRPDATALISRALEICDARRLRLIVPLVGILPEEVVARFGPTREWNDDVARRTREALEPAVARFRPHASLAGYWLVDEPYPHILDELSGAQRILAELDPDHPAIQSVQVPHQLLPFGRMFPATLSGSFPYPEDGSSEVAFAMRSFIETMRPLAPGPFWLCVQSFARGAEARITRAQYRFHAYRIVLGGGDGIVHYVYYPHRRTVVHTGGGGGAENFGFINAIERPYAGEYDLWAEAVRLNRELSAYGPFLAGAPREDPASVRVECETGELFGARRPVVDHVVLRAGEGLRLVVLQNLDLASRRSARVDGRDVGIEPGDGAFVLLGERAAEAEAAAEARRAEFDRRRAALIATPESMAARIALGAAGAPLDRIEAALKERLIVRRSSSGKYAERHGEEVEEEETGTEADRELDRRFVALAREYLAAQTDFVRGRYDEAAVRADALVRRAQALEREVRP